MKQRGTRIILAAGILVLSLADVARSADEAALILVLESSAGAKERCEACRELLGTGSVRSVPALAKALEDERAGHAALHTLERMPFPEAATALRGAIGRVRGPVRVGVVDAIGWRGDVDAVSALAPLLRDDDVLLAAATAMALGRIGGRKSEAVLTEVVAEVRPGVLPSVLEGLLLCAEARLGSGDRAGGAAIYDQLFRGDFPETIRAAALRGLLVSDEARRRELFVESIAGPNRTLRNVALKFLPELEDAGPVSALLPRWPTLPREVKVALLEAHRQLGAEAPSVATAAAADADGAIRLTALRVMGDMDVASLIPVLSRAASGGDKPEQLAARDSLARIDGPGMSAAIHQHLAEARPGERLELLRILGRRGNVESADILLRHARSDDDAEKQAALQSLRLLDAPETLDALVDLTQAAKSDADRRKLERMVEEICRSAVRREGGSPAPGAVLARILPGLRDPKRSAVVADVALIIADSLEESDPELAAEAAREVLQHSRSGEVKARAKDLLVRLRR